MNASGINDFDISFMYFERAIHLISSRDFFINLKVILVLGDLSERSLLAKVDSPKRQYAIAPSAKISS